MAIFIKGDTHGFIDNFTFDRYFVQNVRVLRAADRISEIKKIQDLPQLTKEDYLIIAGDFGVIFNSVISDENGNLDKLERLPWTTLFIDGNHENFPKLRAFPEEEMFGGVVGVLRPSVLHLKTRGQVYTIDGKKIWCFGGGMSVDRYARDLGKTVWDEEEPSDAEFAYGIQSLLENNWDVDGVITHAAPQEALNALDLPPLEMSFGPYCFQYDPVPAYLQFISQKLKRRHWYFGHYHVDMIDFGVKNQTATETNHRYSALYRSVVKF